MMFADDCLVELQLAYAADHMRPESVTALSHGNMRASLIYGVQNCHNLTEPKDQRLFTLINNGFYG